MGLLSLGADAWGNGKGCSAPWPPVSLTKPGPRFLSTTLCWDKGQLCPARSSLHWSAQVQSQATSTNCGGEPASASFQFWLSHGVTTVCSGSFYLPPLSERASVRLSSYWKK
jgi:hypothetical protein